MTKIQSSKHFMFRCDICVKWLSIGAICASDFIPANPHHTKAKENYNRVF
jgi:hypothetical protein